MDDWFEIGRMDDWGRMDTPVHRLDARAKVLVTLAFIVAVMSFPPYTVSALTPFLLYPMALLSLGRIPLRPILRKMLVATPFALAIGLFNPLLDRQPVATLGPWVITGGWMSFASLMFRFMLTVGAALGLVACTGMHRLCAGLEQLGVPRVLVIQLLFLYRYLFVVADEGFTMWRSVALRSEGRRVLPLHVYGSLTGNLLLRSMDRAGRIHRAMVARGFDGTVRMMGHPTFTWRDAVFTGSGVVLAAVARTWNLAETLGRLLTEGLG